MKILICLIHLLKFRQRHPTSSDIKMDPIQSFMRYFITNDNSVNEELQCKICSFRTADRKLFYIHQYKHSSVSST